MTTVVCVCGGRVGVRFDMVPRVLERVRARFAGDIEIIEGDAVGYDRAAGVWAHREGVTHSKFPVNNDIDGEDLGAPKRRNVRMLRDGRPDVCLGFPGFRGTLHMMDICHAAGVLCLDVEFDGDEFLIYDWPKKAAPLKRKRA